MSVECFPRSRRAAELIYKVGVQDREGRSVCLSWGCISFCPLLCENTVTKIALWKKECFS